MEGERCGSVGVQSPDQLADRGQELVDLLFRQAEPVVAEHERGRGAVSAGDQLEVDGAGETRLDSLPGTDGVHRILEQFPDENVRATVEVVGEEIDDSPQVDLKSMLVHECRVPPSGRSGFPHGWECGHLFETTTTTLFCGDLFTQGGNEHPPLTEDDILESSEQMRSMLDYFSQTRLALELAEKLAVTSPRVLACMHGSAWQGDGASLLRGLGARLAG